MSLKPNRATPTIRGQHDGGRHDEWGDDQPYELLANARRRECVRYLAGRSSDRVSVRDLADAVADVLASDGSASDDLRQSVYTSLTQHHLDKLDSHDVVDYDRERRSVSAGSNFEMVTRVSGIRNADRRPVGTIPLWTSTLTLVIVLVAATTYSQLPSVAVLGVVLLNLVPIGRFLQTRFERGVVES